MHIYHHENTRKFARSALPRPSARTFAKSALDPQRSLPSPILAVIAAWINGYLLAGKKARVRTSMGSGTKNFHLLDYRYNIRINIGWIQVIQSRIKE